MDITHSCLYKTTSRPIRRILKRGGYTLGKYVAMKIFLAFSQFFSHDSVQDYSYIT